MNKFNHLFLKQFISSSTSLIFRGFSILIRFVFLIIVLKNLNITEYGELGIITVSSTYLIYIFGFELHNFISKEIVRNKDKKKPNIIFNRFFFSLISFTFLFILIYYFDLYIKLFIFNIYLFFIITFLEHLLIEINRLFYIYKNHNYFITLDFLRKSTCPLFIIVINILDYNHWDLEFLLKVWVYSLLFCLMVSLFLFIKRIKISFKIVFIDIKFILLSITKSYHLLFSLLIGNSIFIIDKYFIKINLDEVILGSYIFFIGISLLPLYFIDGAVFTKYFSKLIEISNKRIEFFNKRFVNALKMAISIIIIFDIFIFFGIKTIIYITQKYIFLDYLNIFYITLVIGNFYCFKKLSEFYLYALNNETKIFVSNTIMILIFLVLIILNIFMLKKAIYFFLGSILFCIIISIIINIKQIIKLNKLN